MGLTSRLGSRDSGSGLRVCALRVQASGIGDVEKDKEKGRQKERRREKRERKSYRGRDRESERRETKGERE